MHYRFDARIFTGQTMLLARSVEDDFRVTIAGHTAGRIFRTMRGSNRSIWFWTVTGPYLNGAQLTGCGDADDLQDAKIAFRSTFDAWHAWAIRQNAPVTWCE